MKHLDGVVTSVDVITPNEKLLEDSRNGHIQAIATANMPDRKKIEYAEKVNEVYNELKGTARQQNKKTFKDGRSVAEELALSQGKLNQKIAYNATKAKDDDKVKLESNDGKTKTYTNDSVKITDSKEVNGNVITYKSIKDGIGDIKYGIPNGSTKDGKSVTGFVINPQFHILKNGKLVLVGEYKNLAGKTEEGSANITMPMNGKEGNIIANKILTNTKSTINIRFENGKYTYGFNVGEGEEAKGVKEVNNNTTPAGGGNSTSGNKTAPTNTKPAGGGTQPTNTQAAPASNNQININTINSADPKDAETMKKAWVATDKKRVYDKSIAKNIDEAKLETYKTGKNAKSEVFKDNYSENH